METPSAVFIYLLFLIHWIKNFALQTEDKYQTACKPGSVHLPKQDEQSFLCDARYRTPDATHPGRRPKTAHARPLFGLAPSGVYLAGTVASPPVRSYRTLSPLPSK